MLNSVLMADEVEIVDSEEKFFRLETVFFSVLSFSVSFFVMSKYFTLNHPHFRGCSIPLIMIISARVSLWWRCVEFVQFNFFSLLSGYTSQQFKITRDHLGEWESTEVEPQFDLIFDLFSPRDRSDCMWQHLSRKKIRVKKLHTASVTCLSYFARSFRTSWD